MLQCKRCVWRIQCSTPNLNEIHWRWKYRLREKEKGRIYLGYEITKGFPITANWKVWRHVFVFSAHFIWKISTKKYWLSLATRIFYVGKMLRQEFWSPLMKMVFHPIAFVMQCQMHTDDTIQGRIIQWIYLYWIKSNGGSIVKLQVYKVNVKVNISTKHLRSQNTILELA